MKRGKLAIIVGPSGSGKDTLLEMFFQKYPQWQQPPSVTTREPRPAEEHGKHMLFVSPEIFKQWEAENQFLETDEFYKGLWYGTLAEPIEELRTKGKNVLLRKQARGALEIKRKVPDAITIFIRPEDDAILEQRIRSRGSESEDRILERLEVAKEELAMAKQFDHVIINATGKQAEALAAIEKILL